MVRLSSVAGAAVVLLLAASATAEAQNKPYFFVGGGLSVPTQDYKETSKAGWMGAAGVGVNVGDNGLFVFADGLYGKNSGKGTSSDDDLWGANGALGYRFGQMDKAGVYVYGSSGIISVDGHSAFAYGGGAGVDIPVGKVNVWIEGRYIGAKDGFGLLPFMIGLSFGGN